MKTFFAAFLGFLAAGVLLLLTLSVLGGADIWRSRTARMLEWTRGDDRRAETKTAHGEAQRLQAQRRRADGEDEELQEQRRERLALLTATLRARPIARLAAAETHLFQEAGREHPRAAAPDGLFVRLLEPVQIDEWTVLQRGTAVELVGAERDNVITIRHDGARYQLSPCQTELRAMRGDVCEE